MSDALQRTISLRDANQGFARMVREVESGASFTITRNGVPVAEVRPVKTPERKLTPAQEKALAETIELSKAGYFMEPWTFNRDELHER